MKQLRRITPHLWLNPPPFGPQNGPSYYMSVIKCYESVQLRRRIASASQSDVNRICNIIIGAHSTAA